MEPANPSTFLGKMDGFAGLSRHGLMQRPWQGIQGCTPCPSEEVLVAKFHEVEQCLLEDMAVSEAQRCLRCDLRLLIAETVQPPDSWLAFNSENISILVTRKNLCLHPGKAN